jgi:hypothetical protein
LRGYGIDQSDDDESFKSLIAGHSIEDIRESAAKVLAWLDSCMEDYSERVRSQAEPVKAKIDRMVVNQRYTQTSISSYFSQV